LQMIYLGTEEAKILTHDLKYLYQNKVIKELSNHAQLQTVTGYT